MTTNIHLSLLKKFYPYNLSNQKILKKLLLSKLKYFDSKKIIKDIIKKNIIVVSSEI